MLGVVDHLAAAVDDEADRVRDHVEVLLRRGAEHLDDVEQPALAEDRHDRRLGRDQLAQVRVVLGPVRAVARRAEGRQLRALPADVARSLEELDVLRVRAGPAALDVGHPELVEHPRDAQLVGERQRDVLALRAVAERGVVEDDGGVAHAGTSVAAPSRSITAVAKAGRADDHEPVGRVRLARQVRRPPARVERRMDGPFDRLGDVRPSERPAGEHRGRQDRPDRVGAVLAGEMRSRAVDRLVQPERAVVRPPLAERRRRQQPERSGKDARLVRQDVAEQVLGHEHVELGGALDEEHRARVDELVVELDVREVRGDLVGNPPPESRRGEDIRLVDAGDATAPGPGQLERKPDDPGDLALGVRQRVAGRALAAGLGRLLARPEVEPAGELAEDQEVDAVEELRAQRRGRERAPGGR